jgi:CheY-like chemotaxis protein
MNHNILFLDDEKSILSSLRRVFMKEPYTFFFASSADEAIQIIKQTEMSVIVSDMRMPEVDGITFLRNAVQIAPDSVRMLLSAYADIQSVMKAVNEGHIWRYITKPWDDNDLRLTIRNGIQFYEESSARKRLLVELAQKNAELLDMNNVLEKKVLERTWQIRERSKLLSLIIEEENSSIILKACCETVLQISGASTVTLNVPFLNTVVVCPGSDNKALDNLIKLELKQKGDVLGTISLQFDVSRKRGEVEAILSDFIPVILLAVSHQKSIVEAPGLIDNITNIIDRLS